MSSVTIDHEGKRTYKMLVSFSDMGVYPMVSGAFIAIELGNTALAQKVVDALRQGADRLERLTQDVPQPDPKVVPLPVPLQLPEEKLATPEQVVEIFSAEAEKRCKVHGREWERLGRGPRAEEIRSEVVKMLVGVAQQVFRNTRSPWWGYVDNSTGLRVTLLPLAGFELDLQGTDLKMVCLTDYPGMVR